MSTDAQTQRHPFIELLARHKAVLKAAWDVRHELAGPRRLADEAAFLPAALSLQETPVHPAPRRAIAVIAALFGIALVWSIFGQVDIVAVAQGRIVVSDRTKVIQPLEDSVVSAIRVKDGDRVQAGQVLIELDATAAGADARSVQEQLRDADSEARRTQALMAAMKSGTTPPLADKAEDAERLRAEWSDVSAKTAKLDAELMHRQAELNTAQAMLAKLQATLPLARQREADFKSLADQGFMSGHAGQDRTRERIELERDLATQQARVTEAQAALAESRNAKAAYIAETQRTLSDRRAQASLKRAQLAQEGAKTAQRERLTKLTAPVAGTVQQLAVHTTGGVVTTAQPLMVIVPDDGEVTADVVIDNKDIGFVREGQVAQVKLETFNFTRYGTVPAKVSWVSADAVVEEGKKNAGGNVAGFPATLKLDKAQIDVDGKLIRLAPGMNLTAEIKTGKRRVIEYLLSPVQQRMGESMKER